MRSRIARTAAALPLAISLGVGGAAAQGNRAQIEAMEDARYTAMIARDRAALTAVMAPDFQYHHTTGNVFTREQFVDQIVGGAIQVRQANRETFTVRDYGDTVVTNGDTLIDFTLDGRDAQSRLRHLNVWRRTGSGWELAVRQSVLLQPQPAR